MKKQVKIGMTCLAATTLALSLATAITLGVCDSGSDPKYTVKFDTRGGSEITSYSLLVGEKIERPKTIPTKDMFVFGDWYTDTTYTTRFEFGTAMPSNDITIYAGWIGEGSIRIEYNANGGAFADGSIKKYEPASIGTALTAIDDKPVFEGYLFDGWYTDPECDNAFDFAVGQFEDITLYACWANDPSYSYVTYYGNGSMIEKVPVKKDEAHTEPKLFDDNLDIENTGWFTDPTFENAYTFGGKADNDIALYTTYYTRGLEIQGNTVVKYNGKATEVIVPNLYNGAKVTAVGDYAFYKTSELNRITSISLPETIEQIAEGAFYDCRYLVNVNLTSKVTEISKNVFWNNERLKSVGDISKVTRIGEAAFLGCKALRTIELPDTLIDVGAYAFTNCSMLTEFVLPAGVRTISDYLLSGCSSLIDVEINTAMLTSIGDKAFENCSNIESIIIRSVDAPTFSQVGDSPFVDCIKARIYVPASTLNAYGSMYEQLDNGEFVNRLEAIGASDD